LLLVNNHLIGEQNFNLQKYIFFEYGGTMKKIDERKMIRELED
jgi:hypothetical protein